MPDARKQHAGANRFRVWPWFIIGFAVTWTGLALAIDAYSLAPDGSQVIACKLWKYYTIETQRAFHDTGAIGQATRSTSAASIMFVQHSLFAAVGGAAALAAAWGTRGAFRKFNRER